MNNTPDSRVKKLRCSLKGNKVRDVGKLWDKIF